MKRLSEKFIAKATSEDGPEVIGFFPIAKESYQIKFCKICERETEHFLNQCDICKQPLKISEV